MKTENREQRRERGERERTDGNRREQYGGLSVPATTTTTRTTTTKLYLLQASLKLTLKTIQEHFI